MTKRVSDGPHSENGGDDSRGRREIIRTVIEDHTFMIFQVALAARRIHDIIESGDLASAVHYRELVFVHDVLCNCDSLMRSVKPWLLAVRREVELREAAARDLEGS